MSTIILATIFNNPHQSSPVSNQLSNPLHHQDALPQRPRHLPRGYHLVRQRFASAGNRERRQGHDRVFQRDESESAAVQL